MTDTRQAVLRALADGPLSGPALADRLGVSRAAVWKHVEALREEGFGVESTDDGYELTDFPEYGGESVEFGLDAAFTVEYHDTVESTNDRARELATDGREDAVVLADRQVGGRGRRDRAWESPSGGIWMSVVLRPDIPPARAPLLTLAMAVAVSDAAREHGVDATIKWPNDVLVSDANEGTPDDGKLAGILTEMEGESGRVSWVVVGVGVNANVDPAALYEGATSLRNEAGSVERRVFVQRVLERFDDLRGDLDGALAAWRERTSTLGRRVRVHLPDGDLVGEAVDVTETGALVVDTGDERRVVHAGDCEHLRRA
ncbi:biotin--[acetyl-CoA-carboxylase] ligase [Salarchaeum sp. JOR-1]|uniref:biotin--[acetyl-CoA-carboxylase] ligase n=1 Tax=Salarchaeum sp. JOR-1 TaxID=2599399 RepID=UPI0011985DD0|nr:biotin--[acetyl-CoA-carboxylase] ligase [Salarchaeum sp. JOR-1]QDX41714.1 biotin--[acetyl-CoA-carboxylase] ligase [Salarchaeum sp. JOR-1]